MKIQLNKIANPYTIFAIAWFISITLYLLAWAEIFPKISVELFLFLNCLIVIFFIIGLLFGKIRIYSPEYTRAFGYNKLFIINIFLFSINFLYSGIPLLSGTRDDEFGIPTVIVIATTLNSFTGIYSFYLYLTTNKIKYLLNSLFCLCFYILIFSRGSLMMSLSSMFFLWMNVKKPTLTFKKLCIIITIVFSVMYLFGVAGNYRSIGEVSNLDPKFDKSYNSDLILNIGGASESFKNSFIPGEFFWTYLYITSPLSNLQYNVNIRKPPFSLSGLQYILIDEILFDSVSKRIDDFLNRKRKDPDLIIDQLTVPTALAGSYNYAGWSGMSIFMIIQLLFPFAYLLVVKNNPLGVIGISILCTIYLFSMFDNTFILTGLSLQVFFPIILNAISKISFTKNRNIGPVEVI